MDLDIKSFLRRLEQEGLSAGSVSALVEAELARAEDLKLGFADEIERAPEFIGQTFRLIDRYTSQLRELQKWFPKPLFPELPEEGMTGSVFREKIAAFLRAIGEESSLAY